MELRQLRYLIAVAEERNITRAAQRLGLQPPPLSRQIKALEREIDAQLFHRKPRGVELTDAGHAFLDNARAVLAQLDHTVETTRRTARGEEGRVSLAYSSTVAFHPLIPRVIRGFREAFPQVAVTLVEGYPEYLIERLQADHIDITFVRRLAPNVGGVTLVRLHEEPMVVALPSGHRLVRTQGGPDAPLSLKALAGETFILFGDPRGDALQRNSEFIAACHAAGFTPLVGQTVPQISARLNLIAAGLGIAIVAASLQHARIEGVSFHPLKGVSQLKAPLSVASRRGDPSPVVRQFLKLAKRVAETFRLEDKQGL